MTIYDIACRDLIVSARDDIPVSSHIVIIRSPFVIPLPLIAFPTLTSFALTMLANTGVRTSASTPIVPLIPIPLLLRSNFNAVHRESNSSVSIPATEDRTLAHTDTGLFLQIFLCLCRGQTGGKLVKFRELVEFECN
jgi:hypothetical protein